ncbi:MAG: hypothetical protein ABI268_09205 [Rhodanobacter sp.]
MKDRTKEIIGALGMGRMQARCQQQQLAEDLPRAAPPASMDGA